MITRLLPRLAALLLLVTLVWVNVPSRIPIKFALGGFKVDTAIEPLRIDVPLSGGKRFTKEFITKFGLDLQGGIHLVFEADVSGVKKEDLADALAATRNIIERRVNPYGVSEPVIQTISSGRVHRISVDLPGEKENAAVIERIRQTALLTFKEEGELDPNIPISIATQSAVFKLTKLTDLTGKDVKKASLTYNSQDAQPSVQLDFTPDGAKKFADITKRNVGKMVGIFLDDAILTYPTVQTAILDGQAIITGQFTVEAAEELAIAINSGALPVPLKLVQNETIGPSLGAADVQKSVIAGIVGLSMVILFMILFYGRLGLLASAGLLLYGLITNALFRFVPVVLTLPGIAGFILSIGMAVDSNILIFERIKEEKRMGKSHDTAVKLGFGKAMDAIKDANITTLLVAFILLNPLNWDFLPQLGLVKGFALTLILGVLTSLFTGVVITRRLLKIFYKS